MIPPYSKYWTNRYGPRGIDAAFEENERLRADDIQATVRANEERSIERQERAYVMECGRRFGKTDTMEKTMYAALYAGPLVDDEPTASTEGYAREREVKRRAWEGDFLASASAVYLDWLREARRNHAIKMAGRIPDETRECELAKKVNDNDEAISDWDDEADDVLSKTRMDAAPPMSAKERELHEPIGRMRFGVSNEWDSFFKESYGSFLDEQREIELAERRAVANISAETLAQWKSPTYTTSGPLTFELVKKMAEEILAPKHEASMAELAELKEKTAQRKVKGPSGREYNFPFLKGIDHGQNYEIGQTATPNGVALTLNPGNLGKQIEMPADPAARRNVEHLLTTGEWPATPPEPFFVELSEPYHTFTITGISTAESAESTKTTLTTTAAKLEENTLLDNAIRVIEEARASEADVREYNRKIMLGS